MRFCSNSATEEPDCRELSVRLQSVGIPTVRLEHLLRRRDHHRGGVTLPFYGCVCACAAQIPWSRCDLSDDLFYAVSVFSCDHSSIVHSRYADGDGE
jgi:hypothetical protein